MRLYKLHDDGRVEESAFKSIYAARSAIKRGETLFPSVTTVAKCFTSSHLSDWKEKQMLEAAYEKAEDAAARTPFDDWVEGVRAKMEEKNTAAAWGTGFHTCTETGVWPEQYEPWRPIWEKFRDEEIGEIVAQEIPLADTHCRVAGRLDLAYISKTTGLLTILDYKSGGWKVKWKPKRLEPTYYLSWPWQLSCYATALQRKLGGPLPRIVNVPVNRDEPMLTSRRWTAEEQERAYFEFKIICDLWHRDNGLYEQEDAA